MSGEQRSAPRRRRTLAGLVILLLIVVAGGCRASTDGGGEDSGPAPHPQTVQTAEPASTTTTQPLPARPADVTPLLIKHGWDIVNPPYIAENAAAMEQLGFDGVVFQIPASGRILGQEEISYEQLVDELAPLREAALRTMTHNFVIIYNGHVGGFEAAQWEVPRRNITNLGRAAAEFGLAGIVYDDENYDNKLSWRTGGSVEEVQARGSEFMSALLEGWPTATILLLHGPTLSEEQTADVYNELFPYNDVSWANPLLGPFFMGMAVTASTAPDATLIDGGQVYSLRSQQDFDHAYRWMQLGLPQHSPFVPDELRGNYGDVVDAAFGVYDRSSPDNTMDPDIWRSTLIEAMRRTDRYVWAYTEVYNWWGTEWPTEPVPNEWLTATADAKREALAIAAAD